MPVEKILRQVSDYVTMPGQKPRADFPRFGLPRYADRFPANPDDRSITIKVNDNDPVKIDDSMADLPRITLQADFHCVTTWSYMGAEWGGVKFKTFFDKHVRSLENEQPQLSGAVLYAQDGYRTSLHLEDLMQDDVMLADTLDGQPLSIAHGAPLRLVAPAHYGYKNLKHLKRIEFHSTLPNIKRGLSAFLDHPRARVNKEERGRWVPGWILRYIYRRLIPGTEKNFRVAMERRMKSDLEES